MKKWYLILLFSAWAKLCAQVNTYFNNDPAWTCYHVCVFSPGCQEHEQYTYYMDGDTLIDSLLYVKMYKKGIEWTTWLSPLPNLYCSIGSSWYPGSVPIAYLRSEGRKIYKLGATPGTETLIYDFNMQVGDSIQHYVPSHPSAVVDSIDSVSTPNGYMRIFYITGAGMVDYIIEGGGQEFGPIEPWGYAIECYRLPMCYSINDTVYLPSFSPTTCNVNVGFTQYDQMEVRIYPNPVNDVCTIQFSYELRDANLFLFDMHGRVIKAITKFNGTQILLERDGIVNGIYFVKIEDDEHVLMKKVIFE